MKRLTKSGRYASASEVVRDGQRSLEQLKAICQTKLDALRGATATGTSTARISSIERQV